MLFSVMACDITSHFPNKDEDETKNKAPETKEQTTEYSFDDKESSPEYSGVFRTGYARVAITPSVPSGNFTKVENDIYATCVAVCDGEKTIMLVSLDIQSIMENYCDKIREKINMVCGIPADDIFISATHNHSGPNFSRSSAPTFVKIANAAKEAVDDLADTEIFIGRGKTTGMAWVRRYVDANGNYATVSPTKPDGAWLDADTTRSVSDADDTMQLVRFKREDKKDIIMTNWQAHLAHAADAAPNAISSDMAHYIREDIEEGDDDALVVYFAGASGNINLNAPNAAQITLLAALNICSLTIRDRTSPVFGAEYLAQDMTIKGELYRTLLPRLSSADEVERTLAAEALRIGLLALDGRTFI